MKSVVSVVESSRSGDLTIDGTPSGLSGHNARVASLYKESSQMQVNCRRRKKGKMEQCC